MWKKKLTKMKKRRRKMAETIEKITRTDPEPKVKKEKPA